MERTRHAAYQQRYRKKVNEINRTNSEFMTHAENKAPWLVAEFFAEKAVILTFFTCCLTIQNHDFSPFQTPYRSNSSSSSMQQQQQQQYAKTLSEVDLRVYFSENQVRKEFAIFFNPSNFLFVCLHVFLYF